MSAVAHEYAAVVGTVRSWPPATRLRLAEAILDSLRQELGSPLPRGVAAEVVRGIATGTTPPPDDETVRRWIEEQRAEKYR